MLFWWSLTSDYDGWSMWQNGILEKDCHIGLFKGKTGLFWDFFRVRAMWQKIGSKVTQNEENRDKF